MLSLRAPSLHEAGAGGMRNFARSGASSSCESSSAANSGESSARPASAAFAFSTAA